MEDPTPDAPDSHRAAPQREGVAQDIPPLLFARYRVTRELGRGGCGVVYLAQDEKMGEPVAVKLLPDNLVRDTEAINGLKREVRRGQALSHVGIARTHTFEHEAGIAALIMEYIEGGTLAELKAREQNECFEPARILPWIEQLCAALDFAHREAQIVHRDLKPRNVMLTSAGKLKVTDFGIAATLCDSSNRVTAHGDTRGTPSYMSPQQASGHKPNALDDIYSLGATIYELLTGKPPFFRGSQAVIIAQLHAEVPPSMAERRLELEVQGMQPIPKAWEKAVAACLAKDPADRPQSAGDLLALLNGKEEMPTQRGTSRESPAPHAPRPHRTSGSSMETADTIQGTAAAAFTPRFRPEASWGRRVVSRLLLVCILAIATAAGGWWLRHRNDAAEAAAAKAEENARRVAAETERQRQADAAAQQKLAEQQQLAAEAERQRLAAKLATQEKEAAMARTALRVAEMLRGGDAAMQTQDFSTARQRYREVLTLEANHTEAQASLQRVDQAEEIEMARREKMKQTAAALLAANVATTKKDWPEARRQYRAVLTLDAANAEALAALAQLDELEKAAAMPVATPVPMASVPKAVPVATPAMPVATSAPRAGEGHEFTCSQFRAKFVKMQAPKGGDIVVYLEFSRNESSNEIGVTLGGRFPTVGYEFGYGDLAAAQRKELQEAPTILRSSTGDEYRLVSVSGLARNSVVAPITSGLSARSRTSVVYRFTSAEIGRGKTSSGGSFSLDTEIVVCVRNSSASASDPFYPTGSVNVHLENLR